METTIETNNNDEINVLRIKLEVVEKELQIAISRAETAENELEQLKNLYKNPSQLGSTMAQSSHESTTMVLCSQCGSSNALQSPSTTTTASTSLPPPPPPPMPNFKPIPVNFTRCNASLKDGIQTFTLNNPREQDTDNISISSNPDVKKSATGRFTDCSKYAVNCCCCCCCYYLLLLHIFSSHFC